MFCYALILLTLRKKKKINLYFNNAVSMINCNLHYLEEKSMIKQLIYISKPLVKWDISELLILLRDARIKNQERDITGYLVYRHEYFMQYLEGDVSEVDELYDKILLDKRHKDTVKIYEVMSEHKIFPEWAMGFDDGDFVSNIKISGLNNQIEMNTLPENVTPEQKVVVSILKTFAQHNADTISL